MTATNATRKRRGRDTERIVAAWLQANGWPYAEPVGAGTPGADITGCPGLAIEVKARRGFSPLAWLKQAASRKGLPLVVMRPDGAGPATVAAWPVMLRLADVVQLLHAADYGTPCPNCGGTGLCELVNPQPGKTHTPCPQGCPIPERTTTR